MFAAALDPISVANQAYDKDFRWWFLALLVGVMLGGIWALKYLLTKSERDRQSFDTHIQSLVGELSTSRQHHHDRVAAIQAESFALVREVTAAVTSCKGVIENNTRESERVREVLNKLNH